MRRATAVLSAMVVVSGLSVVLAPSASARAKIECHPDVVRIAADPIANQGQSSSPHQHTFFGSKVVVGKTVAAINALDYANVSGNPAGTSCANVDDTALYWAPTIYKNGVALPIQRILAYYRGTNGRNRDATTKPFPADARMISRVTNWSCGFGSSRPGPYSSPQAAACHTARGHVNLTAHVDFPECFSGRLNSHAGPGQTADFTDIHTGVTQRFSYTSDGKFGKDGTCPAAFPIRVPQLRLAIAWGDNKAATLNGTLTNSHGGTDFSTYHADFWNTWVQTGGARGGLVGMVACCINRR